MYILRLFLAAVLLPGLAGAQQHVSFSTQDGGVVHADVYGRGDRGLVLAHGGRFNKESWKEQAPAFLNAGFRVLAINFRGAKTVSIVGASFGGEAAADTSIDAEPGEIDRVVLLAAWTDRPPEKIKGRKLFIVARDDANDEGPQLPKIRANFEKAFGPERVAHSRWLSPRTVSVRDRPARPVAARNPALPCTALKPGTIARRTALGRSSHGLIVTTTTP